MIRGDSGTLIFSAHSPVPRQSDSALAAPDPVNADEEQGDERVTISDEAYAVLGSPKNATQSTTTAEQLEKMIKEYVPHPNRDRFNEEIFYFLERSDITEECKRLTSHCELFLEFMAEEKSPGRRLNFLLQEMTREANTIGAKANHADIAHLVVDIKEEVEKIREQVQNIE